MAYSFSWDAAYEAAPDGATTNADTLDTIIQGLKVGIRERAESFFADWDADPLVPISGGLLRTGCILVIPQAAMQPVEDDDDVTLLANYWLSDDNAFNGGFLPIPVQNNWKITAIDIVIDKNTDTSVDISLRKSTFGTSPTESTLNTVTQSGAGITVKNVYTGTETVDGGSYYYLVFVGSDAGRWRFYSAKVTYDETA